MFSTFHPAFIRFTRTPFAMRLVVALAMFFAFAPAQGFGEDKTSDTSAPKGQRVLICGHSFHVFVGTQIATIAKAAGITDHVAVGTQSIFQSFDVHELIQFFFQIIFCKSNQCFIMGKFSSNKSTPFII